MSSSMIESLNYISKQINLYVGSFFYISGLINNILCLLIFLSMKRLKKNPSAIYLLLASIANLFLYNTSFISRIFLPNFYLDPSATSLSWCKLRQYFGHVSATLSLFSTSWAMIDQYLITSEHIRFRQFSTVKIALYLVWFTLLFSLLHSLPLIIYNELIISSVTNITSCSLSGNVVYQKYIVYFVVPFVLGIIPAIITIIFAILAYVNISSLHRQEMRSRIQQQITRMVSAQAVFGLIGMIAYTGQTVYNLVTASTPKSTSYRSYENFALTITGILAYTGYTFNFYIYIAVSRSLRRNFKQMIKKCLLYLLCQNRCFNIPNRIAPTHIAHFQYQKHND